ncbi:MAG: class I SAM-dependent methyltransferase [Myxococcales bacterium]|nr:class I SAM-dependent methyltransferase [Myxococcales bacterium]
MFKTPKDIPWIEELVAKLALSRLGETQMFELAQYVSLVAGWNERHNLTGAKETRQLIEILLVDALVIAEARLIPDGATIIDIGAGAGAPIIPLLFVRQDLRAILVEPRKKRAAFLRFALSSLCLQHRGTVLEQKLDVHDPGRLLGAPVCQVALSRATFSPEIWQVLGLELAALSLVFGTHALKDLPLPEEATLVHELDYMWPYSAAPRTMRVIGKRNAKVC